MFNYVYGNGKKINSKIRNLDSFRSNSDIGKQG